LATGVETTVAPITGVTGGQTITAMSWNYANSTMYLGTCCTTSELYTLDLSTGVATLIGAIGQPGLIAMSFNCTGDLYSVDIVDDNLWSIDPSTGVGAIVGPLNYNANYAQDADFDPATGILYLAAYNNTITGSFRTVDLSTGNTTLVLNWGTNFEMTSFGIQGTCGPPCPVDPPTNPDPPNGATDVSLNPGNATWTNGAGTLFNEVYFGELGSLALVYDGTPITSWAIPGPLDYGTTYGWRVVCKNDTCGVSGPTWTFTTEQDPNLVNVFYEPFSTDTCWTEIGPLGIGNWSLSTSNNAGGSPPTEMMLYYSPTFVGLSQLLSCTINSSSMSLNYVELKHYCSFFVTPAPEMGLAVTYDGGTTSTVLWSFIPTGNVGPETINFSFTPASDTYQLILYHNGDSFNITLWDVDDIMIDYIVPVELVSFTASVNENDVTLSWVTATEVNNQGFEIERNSGNDFQNIGYVAGFGSSSETHSYSFVDASLNEGTYTYRLKQVDLDGSFEYSDVVEVDVTVPDVFALEQNYPNPFNPSTTINFSLAADSKVSLTVFDILGQEVANLINGNIAAGSHEINFNASDVNSGVYFYRIDATGVDGTNFTSVKKMILTK